MTQQLARQGNPRINIEREIQFLSPFEREEGKLPAFIGAVERILEGHPDDQGDVYRAIFNNKIRGPARNVLGINAPADWTSCKENLRQHYKSSKNQLQITNIIGRMQVRSIKELQDTIKNIVEDITEFATFEENGGIMLEIFSGMLVQKIKEIVIGPLAYAVIKKTNLREMRSIINDFVGQDEGNIKKISYFNVNNQHFNQNHYNLKPNRFGHYHQHQQHHQLNNQNQQHFQLNYQNQQHFQLNNQKFYNGQNNSQQVQTNFNNQPNVNQQIQQFNQNQQQRPMFYNNVRQSNIAFRQANNNRFSGQFRRSQESMDIDNLTNGNTNDEIFFKTSLGK